MHIIEPLLLNVLFLIFFIIFIPFFIERSNNSLSENQKLTIKIIAANIGVISCMSYPIILNDGFVFDLREVAVIISGLYGGFPAAIIAWLVSNTFRFYMGGTGFYANLIISSIVFISCLLLTKKFNHGSKELKLFIATIFSSLNGLFVLMLLLVFFDVDIPPFIAVTYFLLLISTTVCITFVIEVFREDAYISQRVVKAEKMEIVSHLASSISHEVRNPLAVVKGFLQLMENTELSKEKQKDFINLSIKEINRANDIIKNYLTFAKPALENMEMIDIKEELKNAVEIITPLANMNAVQIETKLDTYMIRSDRQLLQQCLLNITKNCIEAMPESGKLTIETVKENKSLIIGVTDNGIGMSGEQLARIGEPYFTTKGREGTGLGMFSVFQIIEILKGEISVTSKLNEGTTFLIKFPIVESDKSDT